MRSVSGWRVTVALAMLVAGCTQGSDATDAGTRSDTGSGGMDAGVDAGPTTCARDSECDDAIACTADACAIGNVCRNTPLDELCPAGERCVAGVGCRSGSPTSCDVDGDCADGAFCNGIERCVGPPGNRTCVRGTDVDCDDGNACTIDACDETAEGCAYDTAPGCDAGVATTDGGVVCDPFDPATGYTGTFRMLPGQACDGGLGGGYSITQVSFAVSGGALTITAGPFRLTQSPAPTGPDFDASGSDSCATVRLRGTFDCAGRFRATWTASHTGCGCGNVTSTVAGRAL